MEPCLGDTWASRSREGPWCTPQQDTDLVAPWGLKGQGVPPCSHKSQGLSPTLSHSSWPVGGGAGGDVVLRPLPNHSS